MLRLDTTTDFLLQSCVNFEVHFKRNPHDSSIQEIGSHQQLKTQLGRNLHIRDVLGVLVLFIVIEVLADFFEHYAAVPLSARAAISVIRACWTS